MRSDTVNTMTQSFTQGAAAVLNNSLLNSSLAYFSIVLVNALLVCRIDLSFLIVFPRDQLIPKCCILFLLCSFPTAVSWISGCSDLLSHMPAGV